MRTTRATLLAAFVCAGVFMSGARLDEPLRAAPARRVAADGTLPLSFARAKAGVYTAQSRGYDVRISSEDIMIALAAGEALPSTRVRVSFAGAAPAVVVAEGPIEAANAYLKSRRAGRRAQPRTFGRVRMNAIHPGVDAVFFGSDRQLEYELHVAPGASADAVAIAFDGADCVGLDASGDIVVNATGRQLTLVRPAAYQDLHGTRTPIPVEYVVRDHVARFVLGEYDRTRPLVIHPAP